MRDKRRCLRSMLPTCAGDQYLSYRVNDRASGFAVKGIFGLGLAKWDNLDLLTNIFKWATTQWPSTKGSQSEWIHCLLPWQIFMHHGGCWAVVPLSGACGTFHTPHRPSMMAVAFWKQIGSKMQFHHHDFYSSSLESDNIVASPSKIRWILMHLRQ